MKELAPLLEKLAAQLGTTVQMLWGVLVKQAPISSYVHIGGIVLCIVLWVIALIFVNTKTKTRANGYSDWGGEGKFFSWLFLAILAVVITVHTVANAETIISGLVNPSYWALEYIRAAK